MSKKNLPATIRGAKVVQGLGMNPVQLALTASSDMARSASEVERERGGFVTIEGKLLSSDKLYTAADLLSLGPCGRGEGGWYDQIPKLVGDGVTARQIAEYTDAPIADRRWILTRLLYQHDPRQLVLWAVDCALSVRHLIVDETARDAADCAI